MTKLITTLATATLAAAAHGQGTLYMVETISPMSLYSLDPATGARTLVTTMSGPTGAFVGALTFDCATSTAFLSSTSNDTLLQLDLTTGVATLIGSFVNTAVVMHGMEWDPSTSTLYGGSAGGVYTINTTTGEATLVGPTGFGSGIVALGYHSGRNVMYATINTATDSLYTIDRATGAATLIGPLGGPTSPTGLAYVPDTDTMYLIDNTTDQLYTVNVDTGAATAVGPIGGGNALGLAWVPSTCGGGNPTCGTSDFNGDGDFGTDQDIEAFFACLGGVCCATCWPGGSDFNGDGDFGTDQDIEAFFRVLAGGTC
jgi:DNA-binding beta-propeller fold protein YncE